MAGKIRVDARRIEALQEKLEIDDSQLADRMGKHYNTVRRIKTEQTTSLSGLEVLCYALECHPFDVLVAEGFPEYFSDALASH